MIVTAAWYLTLAAVLFVIGAALLDRIEPVGHLRPRVRDRRSGLPALLVQFRVDWWGNAGRLHVRDRQGAVSGKRPLPRGRIELDVIRVLSVP